MTDMLEPGDPLVRLVDALQQRVPLAPGLLDRVHTRGRRMRRMRAFGGGIVVAAVLLVALAVGEHDSGTRVRFALAAPGEQSVTLVGDFTDWRQDRVKVERSSTGVWQATVKLMPGRYRFAWVVDHDQWRADAHAAAVPDDFGRPTSVLTVVEH